jgi:hypothetical protein
MPNVTYRDAGLTEYDDGTAEAHFTDAEWAAMMETPAAFGYTCKAGHGWSDAEREHGHCVVCESDHDDDLDDDEFAATWVDHADLADDLEVDVTATDDVDDILF